MKELKEEIAKGTPEFIHVFDERKREWIPAWLKMWKRQEFVRLIDNIVFNDALTSYTSKAVFVAPHSKFLLLIDIDVTAAPTDITLSVEFSYDSVKWYKYMAGPFGSLMYEDSAGDKLESIHGEILAPWMRVKAVATGVTAANTFTLNLDIVFNG